MTAEHFFPNRRHGRRHHRATSCSTPNRRKTQGVHWAHRLFQFAPGPATKKLGASMPPWTNERPPATAHRPAHPQRQRNLSPPQRKPPNIFKHSSKESLPRGLAVNRPIGGVRSHEKMTLPSMPDQSRASRLTTPNFRPSFLLTFGVIKPEFYYNYYKLMHDAAVYARNTISGRLETTAAPRRGGGNIRCLDKSNHPNFKYGSTPVTSCFLLGKIPRVSSSHRPSRHRSFGSKVASDTRERVAEFRQGQSGFPAVFAS